MKEQILNPFQSIFDMLRDIEQTIKRIETTNNSSYNKVEIIDRKELAKRLGITPRMIINLEKSGVIKKIAIGSCVRYEWNKVKSALKI